MSSNLQDVAMIERCFAAIIEAEEDVRQAEQIGDWKAARALAFPIPYLQRQIAELNAPKDARKERG